MNRGGRQQLWHVLAETQESHAPLEVRALSPRDEPLAIGSMLRRDPAVDAADDVEAHVVAAPHEQRRRVEQQIDAFLRDDLADVDETTAIARVGATACDRARW